MRRLLVRSHRAAAQTGQCVRFISVVLVPTGLVQSLLVAGPGAVGHARTGTGRLLVKRVGFVAEIAGDGERFLESIASALIVACLAPHRP